MPTIAASIIFRPRKSRKCNACDKVIKGTTARLYGRADDSDKPYAVFMHFECVRDAESLKKLRIAEQAVRTRVCINPKCGWAGKESECMDYKHPVGARLCPQCYEVTEIVLPNIQMEVV